MGPFDFINQINGKQENLIENDPECEKDYIPYITNRSFSYFHDTIFYANEMNKFHHLDKKLQFDFYLNTLRPRKRFAKWVKKKLDDETLNALCEHYNINITKALEVVSILSPEQMKVIKNKRVKNE